MITPPKIGCCINWVENKSWGFSRRVSCAGRQLPARRGPPVQTRLKQQLSVTFRPLLVLQVPDRLYQLVDRSTDGLVTADQVMEFIAGLQAIRYNEREGRCE